MINYPIYVGTLTLAASALCFLLRFILKKYHFLRHGFRTRAKVIRLADHKGNRMIEFGYVPIVEFKGRNGKRQVLETDIFLERFVTNSMLEIGYEFDIIYQGDDVKGMMEISKLKGVIITYSVVAIFPIFVILLLTIGFFY